MKPAERFELVDTRTYFDGPRVIVSQSYKYNKSTVTQDIILVDGSRRIDFQTHANWYEDAKMLRTSFPIDTNANEATCDIQYGNIKRPTHRNTSWDGARFEVCAHKYVDVSQDDYGAALMNDCKYGYSVLGNTLDLNLLRSTNYPAKDADKGEHQFTYSLYGHSGNHIAGDVIRASYELNIPLSCRPFTGKNSGKCSRTNVFTISGEGVIIEAVKKAESSDAVVVRMYESQGKNAAVSLECGFDIKSAFEADMLENHTAEITVADNSMNLSFSPYEIKTAAIFRP
jgi:alpha-mannosidase